MDIQLQPDLEEIQEKPLQLQCEKCDYSSSKFSELQKHIKEIHFKTNTLKEEIITTSAADDSMMHYAVCEICDYQTMDAADYQFHIKTAHESGEKHYEIKLDYEIEEQSSKNVIGESTNSKRYYNCDKCNYFTDRRSQLGKKIWTIIFHRGAIH